MTLTLDGNGTISGLGDIDGHDLETNTLVNISDATFAAQAVGRATLFIDASTNTVGINTTTPAAAVFLEVADGTDPIVSLNNTTNGEVQAGCTSVGGYIGTNSNHPFSIRSNSVEKISVLANGYVGINETNPDRQLKVNLDTLVNSVGTVLNAHPISEFLNRTSDTIERGLEIGAPSSNVTAPVYLKVTGTTSRFAILNSSNNEDLTIADSRVGINITNPASNLHVRDESSAETTAVRIRNFFNNGVDNSKVGLRFETATANNQGGTGIIQGVCGTDAGGTNAQNDGGLRFLVSSGGGGALSEAATFTKFGNLAFPNGQGIDFSASQGAGATSSLLDDYEEGTWTPEVRNSSASNGTLAQSYSANGRYIKIGNQVWITCQIINLDCKNWTSNNSLFVHGYPFVTSANNQSRGAVLMQNVTFADQVDARLLNSRAYSYYDDMVSGGNFTQLNRDDFAVNSRIEHNLVYQAV